MRESLDAAFPDREIALFYGEQQQANVRLVNVAEFSETVAMHCDRIGRSVTLRIYGTVPPGTPGNRSKRHVQDPGDFRGVTEWFPSLSGGTGMRATPPGYAGMSGGRVDVYGGAPTTGGTHPFHIKQHLQDPSITQHLTEWDPDGSYYIEAVDFEQGCIAKALVELGSGRRATTQSDEPEDLTTVLARKAQETILKRAMDQLGAAFGESRPGEGVPIPTTPTVGGAGGRSPQGGPQGVMMQLPDGSWVDQGWLLRHFVKREEDYQKLERQVDGLRTAPPADARGWIEGIKELAPMVMPFLMPMMMRMNPMAAPMMAQMMGMPGMGMPGMPGMGMPGVGSPGMGSSGLDGMLGMLGPMLQQMGISPGTAQQFFSSMSGASNVGGGSSAYGNPSGYGSPSATTGAHMPRPAEPFRAPVGMDVMEQAGAGTAQTPAVGTVAGRSSSPFRGGVGSIGAHAALAPDPASVLGVDDDEDEDEDNYWSSEDLEAIKMIAPFATLLFDHLYPMVEEARPLEEIQAEGLRLAPSLAQQSGVRLFWLSRIARNNPDKTASYMLEAIVNANPGLVPDFLREMIIRQFGEILPSVDWPTPAR